MPLKHVPSDMHVKGPEPCHAATWQGWQDLAFSLMFFLNIRHFKYSQDVTFCLLQDINLTWNTANNTPPDITPCMEHVGLVWVPCGFLWVGVIPYIMFLNMMSKLRIPQKLSAISAIKSVRIIRQALLSCSSCCLLVTSRHISKNTACSGLIV